MADLHLALRGGDFDQVKSGEKAEEFRPCNDHWAKRLEGREYDWIVLTRGYPPRTAKSRRLRRPWRGFRKTLLQHELFGPDPVEVYAIRVN